MRTIRVFIVGATLAIAFAPALQAQSLQKVTETAGTLAGRLRGFDITGTWTYSGTEIRFKSDNLLRKAGGIAAASQIENRLDGLLSGVGFTPGVTTFTFDRDSTFTNTTRDRTLTGTYVLDKESGTLTLKYLGRVPLKGTVSAASTKISLLFEADSFLSVVTAIGGHSGISLLKTVSSIAKSYDGMMVGIALRKE